MSGENTTEIAELFGVLIEGVPKFDPQHIKRVYEQQFSADTVFSYLEKQLLQIVSNRHEIEAMKLK